MLRTPLNSCQLSRRFEESVVFLSRPDSDTHALACIGTPDELAIHAALRPIGGVLAKSEPNEVRLTRGHHIAEPQQLAPYPLTLVDDLADPIQKFLLGARLQAGRRSVLRDLGND